MSSVVLKSDIKSINDYKRVYEESVKNADDFWRQMAKQFDWFSIDDNRHSFCYNFDTSLAPIGVQFMSGSQTNVCHNLIDRNISLGFGQRIAYYWVGHEFDLKRSLTYSELLDQVCKFANVLKGFGLKKGDTIVNYLPELLQTVISMLAAIRLGVVYANTFPGYSGQCLAQRMLDLRCKVLVTSDVYYSYKRFNHLKQHSDEAIRICRQNNHEIKARIFVKYLSDGDYGQDIQNNSIILDPKLDHWWHQLMQTSDTNCPPVWLDSEDPLFVIFSSGSTGKQKAIVHTTGGFMVLSGLVFKYAFNYTDGDVVYCSGCLGWITGQFSHLFGSLANAATVVLSEGSQTYPTPGRWWRIIDEYNVNIFYVNPTDIRYLRSFGDQYVNEYQMTGLKVIGVVGETIDSHTWKWLYEVVGRKRCPIVNTYFQSETGCPVIFPIPGVTPIKEGSVGLPFFGVQPVLIYDNGHEVSGEGTGALVLKSAFPSIARSLYLDDNLYEKTYFHKYPNYYYTGDGAVRDKDGYIWITGRMDDMINHYSLLISPAEVESAVMACDEVSEVAVIPIPDPITETHICCAVVLKPNIICDQIETIVKQKVNDMIGVVAIPKHVYCLKALPKNKSGKIMRKLLAKIAVNEPDLGDLSSLIDLSIIDEIKQILFNK